MRVLGIESSSLVASVALVTDDILTGEYTANFKKTHSQTLLPMLDELAKLLELDLNTVDAIAVAGGPGSFTGLRIGAATAKGLGLALKKPLIMFLPSMLWHIICGEPLADLPDYGCQTPSGLYGSVSDGTGDSCSDGTAAYGYGRSGGRIKPQGERVIFLGDGVPAYREMIQEMVKVPFEFAPAQMNRQRAASVAALGSLALKEEGDGCGYHSAFLVSAGEFNPDYLRKSQAERQREAELSPEGAAGKLPGDY